MSRAARFGLGCSSHMQCNMDIDAELHRAVRAHTPQQKHGARVQLQCTTAVIQVRPRPVRLEGLHASEATSSEGTTGSRRLCSSLPSYIARQPECEISALQQHYRHARRNALLRWKW